MRLKGFSLIETIITITILLIVIVGILGVLQLNIKVAGRSAARVGAVSLVNKRMEMLRNLNYDDIGTMGGIPFGNIPQQETISLNNIDYTLETFIQYVDDSADGLDTDDENGITTDYKRARIEVSWSGKYTVAPVVAVSDFMPRGIETVTEGGTLFINVFDAQIQPVSLANIHIVNTDIVPNIDINVQTNEQGKVVFPGSPSVGEYEIIVTKHGYSSSKTYDATPENLSPDPGHLTILQGQTTNASFAIDKISSLAVYTKIGEGSSLGNVIFEMTGNKIIGEDSEGQPVYKYSQEHTTDINGYINLSDLEWDVYDIDLTRIGAQLYDVSASLPPEPINIEPDASNILTLYLVSHAAHTFLVTVKNTLDDLLVSASVRLFKTGYDEIILAKETGQSFFTPLQSGTDYSLQVIKTGYLDYLLENIEITGQTEITVIMAQP